MDEEDQPSGIMIYTDREIADQEDGEIMDTESDSPKPKRRMTVKFPGINAPIPDNADERLWSSGVEPSSSDISRNSSFPPHRSNYSSDYGSRGHHRESRLGGDFMDDGPPGDPGHSSSMFSFHPRFVGHDSGTRSPSSSRSQSDWSRSPLREEPPMPFSFHSLYYSSFSERHFSPMDRVYDRDRDLSSRFKDRSDERHHRSWR